MTPEEEARDRLLFHLENQTGFWFGLVVSEDAGPRNRLRDAAEAWCKEHGRAFFLHEPDPKGLAKLAVSLASGDSPGVHWISTDGLKGVIESWNEGTAQMLMTMNERREAYRKRFDGGIIVAGRTSLKRILRETAPDLFSIRAFVAEPGEERPSRSSDFPVWRRIALVTTSKDFADPDLALRQLAWISQPEGREVPIDWIRAEVQALMSLLNTGRCAEAELHATNLKATLEKDSTDSQGLHAYIRILVYKALGTIALVKDENTQRALQLWDEAAEQIRVSSVVDNLGRRKHEALVEMLWLKAVALSSAGNLDGAKDALEAYVGSFPSVPDLPPGEQINVLSAHLELAEILENLGEIAPAEEILQKAVSIAEESSRRHPDDLRWQFEVLKSRTALGHAQLMVCTPYNDNVQPVRSSIQTLIPAAALAEKLLESEASGEPLNNVLNDLYRLLAGVLSYHSGYSRSIDQVRAQALTYLQKDFDANPSDTDLGWMLAACHVHRTKLLETADPEGAKESARQARALLAKLPVNDNLEDLMRVIGSLRAFAPPLRKKKRRKSY